MKYIRVYFLNSLFFYFLGYDGWGSYNEVDNFWAIQKLTMGVWSVVIFILVCCSLSRQKFWTNARLIPSAAATSAWIPLSNRISLISTNIDPFYDKFCMNINHCVSFVCSILTSPLPLITNDDSNWKQMKNWVWHPAIIATKMQFTKLNVYTTKKIYPYFSKSKVKYFKKKY